MANGILDPNNFTIAPDSMRSMQDRMLELRQSLPPSLQGPEIGGQPQQTQPEQQQMSIADRINQAATTLASQSVEKQSQATGEKPSRKGVRQQLDEYQGLLDQMNPLKPKQAIGSGSLGELTTGKNNGGILGTGIQPIDILAFSLGAGLARKGSSIGQRLGLAMKVGMLPSQFRDYQEKKISEFGQAALHGITAEIGVANAEVAQVKTAQAKQLFDERNKLADTFAMAGEHGKATAIRAGASDEFLKLTDGDASKVPTVAFLDHLRGMASGATPIPEWYMKRTNAKTPEEARQAALAEYEAKLLEMPPIPTPSGAIYRTLKGMREVPAQPRGIHDIQRDLEIQRRGVPPQTAIQAGVPEVRKLEQTPDGGFMPPQASIQSTVPQAPGYIGSNQLLEQLSKSYNKQDQWVAQYHNALPYETQVKIAPLFQKPLDVGDRQKLVAQSSALQFGETLLSKYDAMVASHNGKLGVTTNVKQYVNELGSKLRSEGGFGGSILGIGADIARGIVQRTGQPFTQADIDFMTHYAQAQSFARGAMNDAANLATAERTMFNHMIGTLLDTPLFFRSSVNSFLGNVGSNYNTLLKANKLRAADGFEPYVAPSKRTRPPPIWFGPMDQPPAPIQIQPGGEY